MIFRLDDETVINTKYVETVGMIYKFNQQEIYYFVIRMVSDRYHTPRYSNKLLAEEAREDLIFKMNKED